MILKLFFSYLVLLIFFLGLSNEELEKLAKLGTKAQKTARRDIAHVVSNKVRFSV